MALPSTVKALRILLYVLMAFVVIAVVGIALQYYPGSLLVQVLSLLPALSSVIHVFYLRPGRNILRITLTVTLSVYILGAVSLLVIVKSPGSILSVVLGVTMLVLLHQRSSREWFAHSTAKTFDPPRSAVS